MWVPLHEMLLLCPVTSSLTRACWQCPLSLCWALQFFVSGALSVGGS